MLNKRASFGFNPPASPSPQPRPASVSGYRSMEMAHTSSDDGSKKAQESADPTHVKVVVRIRPSSHNDAAIPPRFLRTVLKPASDAEVKLDVDPALLAGHGMGSAAGPSGSKKAPSFSYDRVLPEDSTQLQVYEATALSAVDKFMKGYNVTILAYGQTSSGKSYSMGTTGVETDYSTSPTTPTSSPSSLDRSSRIGIIPRAVSDIFERAEQVRKASGPGASYDAKLSFLELYNEDLIDLLGPANGPQVQIREDREGRIIWSGLKEVKVKNTSEVMHYLKEGSARRRTGETGMNATSSRSHAIFSLSLVQRRKANVNASPSTPGKGGIPRPASTTGLPRSVTPSGTRSQTPSSFTPAKSGLMRPASMYGARPGSPAVVAHHDEDDEWVTTTGKFNMVDLAGSERLKRTAAQGDRMKEGIAINSGLLALGNVISALGDPAKARTTTYIPYRDSKLTRLLQDSLGGNAYTVMIACVSPIEYNAGETLNTLKYAARARNIKNAAKANQVEAGWDDVEHLQSTVLRLRKELGSLKTAVEESGTNVKNLNAITEESQGHASKGSQRFTEMTREHDELNRQLLEKSGEIARLTGELQTSRAGAAGTNSSFHDDVAPIIGEYEKAIASFEARIQTLQTNLVASNAERDEQEELLEELDTRQVQQEAYIAELKARVSRLSEREASHETYIHDLELKLKAFAEKEESTSDAVADLRKEIARHKEAEAEIALDVAELERRLSKSDSETSDLRSKVENFEHELQRRDEMYRDLEARMALLDTSAETKHLLSELEVKDQKVTDLERLLQGALQSHELVGNELDKLKEGSQADKTAQEALKRQIQELQSAQTQTRPSLTTTRTMSNDVFMTPAIEVSQQFFPATVQSTSDVPDMTPPITPEMSNGDHESSTPHPNQSSALELAAQVKDLQSRQAVTLQELEQVSSRYRDALQEIDDLATQLKEAKLEHAEITDVLPPSSLNVPEDAVDPGTPSPGASPRASPRKRNMQRHSSTGSLYELGNRRDFHNGRGSLESNRVRPQSLSQELSSAALSPSSHSSWADSTSRTSPISRNRASMPPSLRPQRSAQSLEQEVMSLQKALKDREAEINHLEKSLTNSHGIPSRRNSASALPLQELFIPQPCTLLPSSIPLPPSPTTSTKSIRSSPVTPSRAQLAAHKRAASSIDDAATLNQNEIDRLNELMRSMAQKESAHNELTEKLQTQLLRSERQHVELQTLARDQALNMSAELDALRAQLASAGDDRAALAAEAHATALERLSLQHDASLSRLQESQQVELSELKADSNRAVVEAGVAATSALAALQDKLDNSSIVHQQQLQELRAEHANQLGETERSSAKLFEERIRSAAAEHAELLTAAATNHSQMIESLRCDHDSAMSTLRQDCDALHSSNDTLSAEVAELQQTLQSSQRASQAQTKRVQEAEASAAESLEAVQMLERALQESDAERTSFKKETNQLRFELSTSQDAHATIAQASSKREAWVAELEKHLADATAAREAAEVQFAANVTSPATSRFSLGRTSPNGSQIKHPPPIAPPPTMPPPPVPSAVHPRTPSIESAELSPPTAETKLAAQVGESEKIIATLNKQLSHCEADLQANIDMVNTLESALNDSERNLRKARLQTSETARERDALTAQADALRQQLRTAEQEVQAVRNSVHSERQGLEKRLQEEQLAKERARAQLEARVTAMQNKQSKYQCF